MTSPFRPIPFSRTPNVAALFRGATLRSVDYAYLPPEHGAEYRGGHPGFDADLQGVVFDLGERGHHQITWATLGMVESLSVVREDPYEPAAPTINASDRVAWRPHIAEQVTSVGFSWHDDTPRSEAQVWSMRLDFPVGSVVIALGGGNSAPSAIRVEADELVVISEAALAHGFRPPNSVSTAWGRPDV